MVRGWIEGEVEDEAERDGGGAGKRD